MSGSASHARESLMDHHRRRRRLPRCRRRQLLVSVTHPLHRPVGSQDLDELHEHLPIGFQGIGDDELLRTVVATSDRTKLDARNAGALEEDDVGGAVATDANRVAVKMPRRDFAERLYERVPAGNVGRLVCEEDLYLGREVYRADLASNLLRVLLRQVADVEVIGATIRDAVYDVAANNPGHVAARIREELAPLPGERQLQQAIVVLVGQEHRVLSQPGSRPVRALTPHGDPEVQDPLCLETYVEVRRLARNEEVTCVSVL